MKKVINIGLWILLVVGVLTIQSFVSKSQDEMICRKFDVKISSENGIMFITDEDIKEELKKLCSGSLDSIRMKNLNINKIEESILNLPEVEKVEVYKTLDGVLSVRVDQRKPIVRIINRNNISSYYVDKNGYMMPMSINYTAHVPVVNGYVNEGMLTMSVEDIKKDKKLRDERMLDEIYDMASYLSEDKFLSAQIQQLYINKKKEFVLIPRVGNHKVFFGKAENIEGKFEKLKLFYMEGLGKKGWNKYSAINLKYKDQIVCTKR